jgi:diguanylate cyclase (GGDEF)-like protein
MGGLDHAWRRCGSYDRPLPREDAMAARLPLRYLAREHGFAIAGGVLVLVGMLVVFAALQFRADSSWVEHTHRVIREIDAIKGAQDRSGIRIRNYLLAGDRLELAEWSMLEAENAQRIVRLADLVADNASQRQRVDLLRHTQVRRRAAIDRALADPSRQDAGVVSTLGGLRKTSDGLFEAMIGAEERLLAQRAQRSERTLMLLLAAAVLALPLSLLMLRYGNRLLANENRVRARAEAELGASVEKLQRLSVELEALTAFAGLLQGATSMDELFVVTSRIFPQLLPGCAGQVFLIKSSRDHADVAATWGSPLLASDSHPAPGSCWAVRRQRPHLVADVATGLPCGHVLVAPGEHGATACLPLGGQGEAYGWLTLTAPQALDEDQVKLAGNACEQLSLALGNARLRDALRHQSIRDPLTGLYNRRYLEEGMARELARCMRRKLPLALMMLDLDNFKAFNDTHGHAGGDAVLAMFGKVLEAACRAEDIPCRFGGEEFSLVLPEATAEVAMAHAERIRSALATQVVRHMGHELGQVTVSIGIAAAPVGGRTVAELIHAADAALYRAKKNGRDRAELA